MFGGNLRYYPTTHTVSMKNESKKTLIKEVCFPHPDVSNFTSSAIEPKESPTEISDKISKMMPDIGVIRATGIIKNTDSFKESKQLLDTFKTALQNSTEGTFNEHKPDYSWEESDGKPALERVIDSLETVVKNMLRAGIEVPPIFKDFLHATRPPEPPQELEVVNQPPLFKITGVDENGEVIVKTDTPIVLKKGNTEIALTHEKLTDTITKSQKVDCKSFRELHSWVKQNIHRVGTLEKIEDNEWNKLRQSIIENYNKHIDLSNNETVDESESKPKVKEDQTVKIEVPSSVNMNAYEIRLKVLQESLDWIKHNKNTNKTEDVLDVANRFYKFVENRK